MEKIKGRLKVGKLWHTVETKTSDYVVKESDTGKLLVGNKSGSGIVFTLPVLANAKGCSWRFIQKQDQDMTITGGDADKMVAKDRDLSDSVAFSTASNKIGAACEVVCDGSFYYFLNLSTCTETPSG